MVNSRSRYWGRHSHIKISTLILALIIPLNVARAAGPVSPNAPMGVNLEGLEYYSNSNMFVDVMKMCPTWGSADVPWDGKVIPRDSNGWPTTDFGIILMGVAHRTASGLYHLSFIGQADLAGVASQISIQNKTYDPASNTTKADVVLSGNVDDLQIIMSFKNTRGGARNIRFIRPGYAADTQQIFTDEFLAAIQPFQSLRFMDPLNTNSNVGDIEWSSRLRPGQTIQVDRSHITWEDIIALGNVTGKALWINVPITASKDYYRQLAQLFKSKLNSNVLVYIEAGNEFFSWNFPASQKNLELAKNEGLPPEQRYARIIHDVSEAFRTACGDDAMMTQIRPVLATQYFYGAMFKSQLNYLNNTFGAPRKYLYGLAGAPYFAVSDAVAKKTNVTIDDIINDMSATVDNYHLLTIYIVMQATYYGLELMSYEGGPDTTSVVNTEVAIASQRDPRMKNIVIKYLKNFWFLRGGLFMWYSLSGSYSKWGTWGLVETVPDTSPKYEGAVQVSSEPSPERAFPGITIPNITASDNTEIKKIPAYATIMGNENNEAFPGTVYYWHPTEVYEYFMNASKGGVYGLKIGGNATGGVVDVYINNELVGTWKMPGTSEWDQTPAISNELTVPIPKGYFTLHLKINKQVWPDYLIFTRCATCFALPKVMVSASAVSGPLPFSVNFNANASPDPSDEVTGQTFTYQWSFGDGSSSKEQNPSHSYASPGSYLAKLTVTNFRGDTASSTLSLQYSAPVSSGERNVSDFYVSPSLWRSDRDVNVTFHNVAIDGKIRIYSSQTLMKEIPVTNDGEVSLNIKIEQFPSGTYLCRYTAKESGRSQTYKFVVVR